MRAETRHFLFGGMLLVAGCSGPQSALDPAVPSAASLHLLGLITYVGAALVTLLVTVLMLIPILRRRERPVTAISFYGRARRFPC